VTGETPPLPLSGVGFPFRIDPRTGRVATAQGTDKLTQNLQRLLLGRVGERVMLRDYGGGVNQLLQENLNDALVTVARQQVGQAILRYEPRVVPQDIGVVARDAELFLRVVYLQGEDPGVRTAAVRIG
jgi:phage baseplate assembly protein W